MKVSTLIKRLQEVKEKHGDIMVGADIEQPARFIVVNYLETVEELDSFQLSDIEEPQVRQFDNIKVEEIYYDYFNKNPIRKTAVIRLI